MWAVGGSDFFDIFLSCTIRFHLFLVWLSVAVGKPQRVKEQKNITFWLKVQNLCENVIIFPENARTKKSMHPARVFVVFVNFSISIVLQKQKQKFKRQQNKEWINYAKDQSTPILACTPAHTFYLYSFLFTLPMLPGCSLLVLCRSMVTGRPLR